MGEVTPPAPVTLFCGLIAADAEVVAEARCELQRSFGPVEMQSDPMPFTYTDYYTDEMGKGLARWFVTFAEPVNPGQLAEVKLRTNAIEQQFARHDDGRMRRRVNLDPGLLDGIRIILATTKDHAHRVYIGQGIFAEVTLIFRKNVRHFLEWTYPDYRSDEYGRFFMEARRRHLAKACRVTPTAGR